MDRFNFYFEQLVGEADMDEVFDFAENADHALMSDNGYTGVVAGLGVTENTIPDLNVIVAIGTAYDQTGERIRIGAPQTLDMSTDSNAVSTTVAVNGNEKWLSIFVEFARVLSDPRVDGNGVTIQYRETESFTLIKEQGAEAAPGTAASLLAVNSEPYAPGAGGTLTIQVNGSAVQTVTLAATDTTAALVALAINTQTTGINATDSAGAVLLETFTANAIAKLQVTGGTAAAAFAFPGGIASGAGGPTPPALKGDALLLADVLVRRDGGGVTTTQIFNAPDVGGAAGYVDEARRQVTFIFNGTTFEIREGTITGFATQLAQDLQNHISNTGNAHPSTAITFDGTGSTGPDLPPLGATATVDSALDELDLRKASLGNANAFTDFNAFTAIAADGNVTFTIPALGPAFTMKSEEHAFVVGAGLVPSFRWAQDSLQVTAVGFSLQTLFKIGSFVGPGVPSVIQFEITVVAYENGDTTNKSMTTRFIGTAIDDGAAAVALNAEAMIVFGGAAFVTGPGGLPSAVSVIPEFSATPGGGLILKQTMNAGTTNFVATWTSTTYNLTQ